MQLELPSKAELRAAFLSLRGSLSPLRRQRARRMLAERLADLIPSDGYVLSFVSIGSEIAMDIVNERLTQEERLALPSCVGAELKVFLGGSLVRGPFGTFEPDPAIGTALAPEAIAYALIPGVAFDERGMRLGFGKGYFDRLLPRLTCPCIGIGFSEQMAAHGLPSEPHDAPLDGLLLV